MFLNRINATKTLSHEETRTYFFVSASWRIEPLSLVAKLKDLKAIKTSNTENTDFGQAYRISKYQAWWTDICKKLA